MKIVDLYTHYRHRNCFPKSDDSLSTEQTRDISPVDKGKPGPAERMYFNVFFVVNSDCPDQSGPTPEKPTNSIMPHAYFKSFIQNSRSNRGFTLIEMLVVMVIIGILAVGVVFMFTDPTAKVKAAAFEMRGDMNLARGEAVRRNENILIQFVTAAKESCGKGTTTLFADCFGGGSLQGYVICFNEDSDGTADNDCSDEAADATELADKIIKTVIFRDAIQYYDFGATLPSSPVGATPNTSPDGVSLVSNNGITFSDGDYLYMMANGTSSDTGSVIVYLPQDGDPASLVVKGRPYAVVVGSESTGSVHLERWNPNLDKWTRK